MDIEAMYTHATGGHELPPPEWLSAAHLRPLVLDNPGELWLDFFGLENGFHPDDPPYGLLEFIEAKTRQFREKWIAELAPEAVEVCAEPAEASHPARVAETLKWMQRKIPVISHPALWWAPESIYGVPDLIVRTSWLADSFLKRLPDIAAPGDQDEQFQQNLLDMEHLANAGDQYVILNIRFTNHKGQLVEKKTKDQLDVYLAQLKLLSFILGKLQGSLPSAALLATRQVFSPPAVFQLPKPPNQGLSPDLVDYRLRYQEIRLHGAGLRPWVDPQVAINPREEGERWKTAREIIFRSRVEGGDLSLLYQIGANERAELQKKGWNSLQDLLEANPSIQDLEEIKGVGEKTAVRISAILQANRSGVPVIPPADEVPPHKPNEFFVKLEYFSNLDVDFEAEWPDLSGKEMIFLIGVGWEENGGFEFRDFQAAAEDKASEKKLLKTFVDFLKQKTGEAFKDPAQTALYHWHGAQTNQIERFIQRHQLTSQDELASDLSALPWNVLQNVFLDSPAAVPGAWSFRLKEIARALGKLDPQYDPGWPSELTEGLSAMVLGWQVYAQKRSADPQLREEAAQGTTILKEYLQADCRLLWQVLRWLRNSLHQPPPPAPQVPPDVKSIIAASLEPPLEKRRYAGLGSGKGIQMFIQPVTGKGRKAINHLIWGDQLEVIEENGDWLKVQSRGTTGWVLSSDTQETPVLEVNFVDVCQGDGVFIVLPAKNGPEYLLIDAGQEDNMYRFLSWRFQHFKSPVRFKAFIITHPDADHYQGFSNFFNPGDPILANLTVDCLYHSGIVERKADDLGAVEKDAVNKKLKFLTEIVSTRAELEQVIQKYAGKKPGNYLKLLQAANEAINENQQKRVKDVRSLKAREDGVDYLEGFTPDQEIQIEVLAPVPVMRQGKACLPWIEDTGKTKNGHSVVLRLVYKNVRLLFGGDLNIPAENLLLDHYEQLGQAAGDPPAHPPDRYKAERYLRVDVAKCCHHGSADFTSEFLQATLPLVTIISSGDEESYCHPRPESLGAIGRYSRIDRPLIFSTELARSAPERLADPDALRKTLEKSRKTEKLAEFAEELIQKMGRVISVYGMIALRTDGERVLIAQKLEKPRSAGQKWDLYLLAPDNHGQLAYKPGGK